MKKNIFFILIIFLLNFSLYSELIYDSYIQVYGEGPIGFHYGESSEQVEFSKEEAVELARKEIMEFLSGMVYGYNFVYKVENPINNRKGYFEITPIGKIHEKDRNIYLTQYEKSGDPKMFFGEYDKNAYATMRLQIRYRLTNDQKAYLRGFQSSLATMSMGQAVATKFNPWATRLDIYKEAMKNAVYNEARRKYKSRPLMVKGKILLIESPRIVLASGEWQVNVKTHVMLQEVSYMDVY